MQRFEGYHADITNRELQQAAISWIDQPQYSWDVAACWHVPLTLQRQAAKWDDEALKRYFRQYLNQLDRRVYRSQHKRRGQRVRRFITIEHSDTAGWHVHGTLATPQHMTREQFIELLQSLWMAENRDHHTGFSRERLFWAAPLQARYIGYSLKTSYRQHEAERGYIDLDNTYLGPQQEPSEPQSKR